MAKVDIVTTTYRNVDKLKICLNSVIEKTKFVDYKWYVWANDPNEEVKQAIHDSMFIDDILFNDHIEPIYNDNNDGSFSSNNNEAAAEGDSEYILFMNDDIEPLNDAWLLNMTRILDTDPKVGAVGALLLYPDKKLVQHCGVMFDERTNGLPYHIFYQRPPNRFMLANRYYQSVTAACMLVRRNAFEELGGFDERYIYGYEDVDLCLKMKHKLKLHSVYCAEAQLIHHEGISGTFKEHPHLKNNMKIFREEWRDKIYNDHQFYLRDANFMVYKSKTPAVVDDD